MKPVLITLALILPVSVAAEADAIREGVCYRTELPRSSGPVRSVTALFDKSGVTIQYTEWDAPNARFVSDAECRSKGPRLYRCGVECDGGHVDLALTADGRLGLYADGLRASLAGLPSRLVTQDQVDGAALSGLFFLAPANVQQCSPAGETYPVPLGPGDDTPAVTSAETMLNGLGFLLEKPDRLYTDKTADAVRRFQATYGLPATGNLDPATAKKLVAALSAGEGGC